MEARRIVMRHAQSIRIASRRRTLVALSLLALAGCGTTEAPVMELESGSPPGTQAPLWPAGASVPRYVYAGELTGEGNFRGGEEGRSGAARVLAWIVGLGEERLEPVVLLRPQSGVNDESGRTYVTDVGRQAVFVFDEAAGRLLVWDAADDTQRFVAPIGIAVDDEGGVLVADAELGAVFRLDREGNPRGSFGADVLERPTGLARDPRTGYVYVADTRGNDVKIFDEAGLLVDFLGRGGKDRGELNAPTYIAFRDGRLYVTDTLNSRIQVFDRDGRVLEVFGERGLYVGNLARPKGVAVDDEGNVYVVESYYDHLLVFDDTGRFLLPVGGTGHAPGQFYLPAGVWTDSRNRIYVADMFNGRVSIFQFLGGS
jgi:DNA-binding beta-propeller fold protein YncE